MDEPSRKLAALSCSKVTGRATHPLPGAGRAPGRAPRDACAGARTRPPGCGSHTASSRPRSTAQPVTPIEDPRDAAPHSPGVIASFCPGRQAPLVDHEDGPHGAWRYAPIASCTQFVAFATLETDLPVHVSCRSGRIQGVRGGTRRASRGEEGSDMVAPIPDAVVTLTCAVALARARSPQQMVIDVAMLARFP